MCVYFSFDIVTRLRQQYSVIIYSFRVFSPLLVSYHLVISLAKGSACRFFNRSPLVTTSWHNSIRRQKGQRLVSLTMMIFLTLTSSMVDQLSKSPCFSACFVFLAFFVYFR
ncbi:hypothetical protein C8J56DRAFT_960631, partial [Mycena floridula]